MAKPIAATAAGSGVSSAPGLLKARPLRERRGAERGEGVPASDELGGVQPPSPRLRRPADQPPPRLRRSADQPPPRLRLSAEASAKAEARRAEAGGSPPFKKCEAPHLDAARTDSRRQALMRGATVEALAETFRVLGDPTRVRILDVLAGGELCVCDIASLVAISESAASHQLRLLRHMRLVRPRRAGRQVFYSVDDHHILELLKLAGTHVQELGARS